MLVSYALNTQLKASKANYEDMDRKDLYVLKASLCNKDVAQGT